MYHLYVTELQESLRPPIDPKVSVYQTNSLIRAAERLGPGTAGTADAEIWIWSNLHLGHEPSRVAFQRLARFLVEGQRVPGESTRSRLSVTEQPMP